MSDVFNIIILIFLIICAIAVAQIRDLLSGVIVFASYGLAMAIMWLQLSAPDVALTEAALGTGVTTLLLIATISKTRRIE